MLTYTEISFPGLGISKSLHRITLGSFSIRWYGLVIALGLCLAVLHAAAGAASSASGKMTSLMGSCG